MNAQSPESPSSKREDGLSPEPLDDAIKSVEAYEQSVQATENPSAAAADPPSPLTLYEQTKAEDAAAQPSSPITMYEQAVEKNSSEKASSATPEAIEKHYPSPEHKMRTPMGDIVDRQAFEKQAARDRENAKTAGKNNIEKSTPPVSKSEKTERDWSQYGLNRDFSNAVGDDGGKEM